MARVILLITFFIFKLSAIAQVFADGDTFCTPVNLTLTGVYKDKITHVNQAKSWSWSMPGLTPDTFYSTTDSTVNFQIINPGSYRIDLTIIGRATSDPSKDTVLLLYWIYVYLDPAPPSNILGNDTTYCGDFTRVLDAGNAGSTYAWTPGGQTTRTITVNKPGIYSVNVSNKCKTSTFDIELDQKDAPTVDLGPDGFVCFDNPRTLNAGTDGILYNWTTGELTQTIQVAVSGTYGVTVTNATGCSSYNEIVLKDSCPPDIFVPNVFTPNGDKLNDMFMPYLNGVAKVQFSVYDRWGERLFTTSELGKGWDGKFNGELCQQDVYFWMMTVLDNAGYKVNQSGMFLLMR